jgi:sec-independent protein translocase protein TatA
MLAGHLPELMIVVVLALIVFGPKRLPEIGGALGKGIRDFKQGMSHLDVTDEHHDLPVPVQTETVSKTSEYKVG